MATDASMDWSQSTPNGYVPAFRSGHINQLGHAHDANNTYMVHNEGAVHDPRSHYAANTGYHTHNAHLAQHLHTGMQAPASGIEEQFWQQQHDPSREDPFSSGPPAARGQTTPHEPADDANNILLDGEEPVPDGPVRLQRTTLPRSERRKHYKPKPEPSNPRLFRPFQPLETADTTPTQWTMPPIVGSWLMFSNKMVKYRPMPPDTDIVRGKLFKMETSILLKNSQEVADYVPHITNLWRRAVQRVEIDEETGLQTEYWHCRTKKAQRVRKDEGTRKGIRNREKKSQTLFHDQEQCKMRIRVTSFTKHGDHNPFHLRVHGTRAANGHVDKGSATEHNRWGGGPCKCVAEWVHFQLACVDPEVTQHTHDLEIMDGYKRSEALAVLAKNKVEEGNGYSATTAWMIKTFGETSKQVSKFDKGDAANAAQMWRNESKDLVLREEVPEDSEEMTTMRKCVDAILEADAPSLRAALREVLKDSHDLTKSALAILEKHKPTPSTEPEEKWWLAEGVATLDLPPPGPTEKLKDIAGVYGPPRTPYSKPPTWQIPQAGQGQPVHAAVAPNVLGPDGRPIARVTTPGATAPLQGNTRNVQPLANQQHQWQIPVNAPNARGVPLQPRPTAPAYGAPPNVEIRYVQAPPSPAPPPQRGSVHPIMVSMEVPSCPQKTCQQCKHMHRDLAGRTFVFQDCLQTPAQFTKLQNLLRDPGQLLNENYARLLCMSQVPIAHPQPAYGAPPPQPHPCDDQPLQRVSASAPSVSQLQHLSPPVQSRLAPQATAGPSSRSVEREMGVIEPTKETKDAVLSPPQPARSSTYDQALPVSIVIDDDNEASDGGRDDNTCEGENVRDNSDDVRVDNTGPEKHADGQDATVANNDNDEDADEDEDERRPAKRRRQGSVSGAE